MITYLILNISLPKSNNCKNGAKWGLSMIKNNIIGLKKEQIPPPTADNEKELIQQMLIKRC